MNPLLAPGGLLANAPTASFLQLAQALEFVNSRGEEIPSQGRLTENDALRIAAACQVRLSRPPPWSLVEMTHSVDALSSTQWFYEISVLRSISAFVSGNEQASSTFLHRDRELTPLLTPFSSFYTGILRPSSSLDSSLDSWLSSRSCLTSTGSPGSSSCSALRWSFQTSF